MKILIQLKWFFQQQWRQYLSGILALVLIAVCNIIPARIIGNVVDAISTHQVTVNWLVFQVVVMLVAAIAQYGLRFVWQKMIYGSSYVLERQLRGQLFHHYLEMDPTFYQRHRIGDLMAHATNDVEAVREVASYGILTLVDSIITGGSMIIAMGVFVSWKLTLLTLIPLPLLVILSHSLGNKIHVAYGQAQEAFGQLNNKVQESMSGIRVIQSFGEEQADIKDFHQYVQRALKTNQRAYFWDALFNPATTLIMGIAYVIAIAVGSWMIGQGQLSIGKLVTLITYLGELVWPLFAIGTLFNTLERGRASYDRISALLSERVAWFPSQTGSVIFGEININIKNFQFPDSNNSVLKEINFKIPVGAKIGIIGPTGSGKTTLLRLLVRDFDHYQGEITMVGQDIRKFSLGQYRQQIGYVPQIHFLFSTTIEDNLRFSQPLASQEKVVETAKKVVMADEIGQMPEQYQTEVGQNSTTLSGGQQQRITLGRVILKAPQLLVLDDPLSAVDAETATQIETVLESDADQTLVMATTRLSTVQQMDWLIVMENGQISAQGTPTQLRQQAGWYQKTLDQQLRRQKLEDDLNE